MLTIRQTKFFKPCYAVTDSEGAVSEWQGRFGREGASAVLDGEPYVARRDGRKRFVLKAAGQELAVAERVKREWRVSGQGEEYVLVKRSAWRSTLELRDQAGEPVGSISRRRRTVMCDLPDDLPAVVQAFLGFVAMALWNREAAAAGAGTAGATAAASS